MGLSMFRPLGPVLALGIPSDNICLCSESNSDHHVSTTLVGEHALHPLSYHGRESSRMAGKSSERLISNVTKSATQDIER